MKEGDGESDGQPVLIGEMVQPVVTASLAQIDESTLNDSRTYKCNWRKLRYSTIVEHFDKYWVTGQDVAQETEMGRIGCTGQCCPFCPFLYFLCDIPSSHPVQALSDLVTAIGQGQTNHKI